jgi:TatD DNase family protein
LGGVALHPTSASELVERAGVEKPVVAEIEAALAPAWAQIAELARAPRIRVVGETGLDHHWVHDEVGQLAQEVSFRWHVRLAKELGSVLQIHDRLAHDDVLRVLADEGAPERTVFHCFSGDRAMAEFCAAQGWYLSFAGPVTFKNSQDLRAALEVTPRTQILVETDAPYLTPEPNRGRPNASHLMPYTVRFMAAHLGAELKDFCQLLSDNTEQVYGSW